MNEKHYQCNCSLAGAKKLDEQAVDKILQKHRGKPDALLQVLLEMHSLIDYIPENIVFQIAEGLDIPPADVFGMLTYYPSFKTAPPGKYKISVCLGTNCYLRGSSRILERLCQVLNIEPGDTTPDGKFSLEAVRCLGACALSPVIMINEVVYPQVEPQKIPDILISCEKP
ncbi:complex I 24 kDa subunit family protein [Desulfoscipio geothermicus]|uniref:NADP-reducing hydrogenase subunit HndA n=1 Tax=Desulfoscipio geothermicus DSM 3669 TaxID=1121426 RepID=A0A1I6D8A4_9FIRM|nr:NAD(P)H-dependent oxidoreductase subunit E [Desulfoscipio geothermicus]SFR01601.1 NADP-reducing hydrogenase subunit HndA [Desulfoscipio geothermicus DSM 3669]